MGDWRKTTAKVLNHLRSVFNEEALKNATEQEQAAVKGVWAFIRVKMLEYWEDVDGLWGKIKPNRRRGVRQQLLTRFPEEAFLDNERGKAARDEFTRADLLAWGEQLRAEDAANAAAAANAATSAEGVQGDPRVSEADVQDALRLFVLEKPEGGEAVDAAAASAAAGAAVAARVAVDAANAAVLRMLARRPVNTADEAAGPTNAERDSQMESSPTTASWPRPSAPFMATQHPAPFNTQGVRNYSPAYPPTPLPPLFNVSDAMLMGGGGALNAALRTAAGLGGKTSRKSHSSRSSPNMSPAGRSVVSDVSRKSRSNRSTPNLSPNPSPPMSTGVASDLSNLRCLDYVQLCRDVANGSLQLDDERPLTRKELRAAEREAKLRRAARAQEKIDQANTNSTIQLANRQPLDARFHEVGQEDKQRLKQLIQTIEGRADLIESQMDTLRRMRCRADRHTAVMSLAHARLHYERNKIKRTDSLENFKVYQEDSNRRFQEAYRAARKKGFAPATAMEQAKQNVPDSDLARPSRAWPRALWQETREKIIGRIWPPPQSNPGRRERGGKALEP